MNVNGARFHLLLGRDDWGRCLDRDGDDAIVLESVWDAQPVVATMHPERLPAWDKQRAELTLLPRRIELPATSGEAPLTLDARRGAAADRYGNVYLIGDDRLSLRVMAAGGGESTFWPARPDDCAPVRARERLAFETVAASPAPLADVFLALAATTDDYLVVAFARGAVRGFQSFDLLAGGAPVETTWPRTVDFAPFDMCARCCGGVWVLDREHRRLWELDRTLAVVRTGQTTRVLEPSEADDFQPITGAARSHSAKEFPGGVDLASAPATSIDPIAIVPGDRGAVLVLDRDTATTRSRVLRLRREGESLRASASSWLTGLPALAHDFIYSVAPRYRADGEVKMLFVTSATGNQAHAFVVTDTADRFQLDAAFELFPLRRYAGRALISVQRRALYDSGFGEPAWAGIVEQPRPSFETLAELVSPVFDSANLGTTWDKVLIDACIPADTSLEVSTRASDDWIGDSVSSRFGRAQVIGAWIDEPVPRLRDTGPELPWLRDEAARSTRRESGAGTWELLLQSAHGRYLQLRLRLRSRNGTGTPRLRALRVWSPRFSYTQRFLPAVYREDTPAGAFLERWLANFESTLTQIEDRVVNAESLFDPRTVPDDALDWLSDWFDVALDPAWDERRHRLFVQRAMDFFRWRGTVHGLRLALELAFDPCFDADMFGEPRAADDGPRRIRIVEAYQRRVMGALAAGDPTGSASDGPRVLARQAQWTPAEGNAGLAERWARALGREASPAEQITPFSLVPPSDTAVAETWRSFLVSQLGFVPTAGAAERLRWQRFLVSRYGTVDTLNEKHGTAFTGFDLVPLPDDEPTSTIEAADWRAFLARTEGSEARRLWQDFLARRYRRIERLRSAYRKAWSGFDVVSLPDSLPTTEVAMTDWLQFERELLAMHRTAHRFSVLLPVSSVTGDPNTLEQRLGLARRLVDLEKPAHTVFDVRYYWAFNRVGEARLELDTQLGAGSRAPELIPDAVVGRAYIGASFVGGRARLRDGDRMSIDC